MMNIDILRFKVPKVGQHQIDAIQTAVATAAAGAAGTLEAMWRLPTTAGAHGQAREET